MKPRRIGPALRVVSKPRAESPAARTSWWLVKPSEFATAAKREEERLRQQAVLIRRTSPN